MNFLCRISLSLFLFSHFLGAAQWDIPFTSDVRAAMAESKSIKEEDGESVRILLDEHRYTFDKLGRARAVHRKVYRLTAVEVPDDWASVEQSYAPWHEERPALKARVITPDGAVHWLDAKTIADSPASETSTNTFTDRRVLRAPLPAVRTDSIVEVEIQMQERAPLLDAGVVRRVFVPDYVAVERFRLVIDAPPSLQIRTRPCNIGDEALKQTEDRTGRRWQWELGPMAAVEERNWDLPPDTTDSRYVAFSTGASWQAVARAYEEIVERQIRDASIQSLLEGMNLKGTPQEVAERLVAVLHREVRYTGIEFGEAAIVPTPPAEVLKRKYGDCKDKAALLVSMLRVAGLPAHLALLSAGPGLDIDKDLPGLGGFDHAIVYVASNPPLWIDATASDTRVGLLPSGAQGRWALVARASTELPVQTPESTVADNWERHVIEMRFTDMGLGSVVETIEASGTSEATFRSVYSSSDEKNVRETLTRYVKQNYAGSLKRVEWTKKEEMGGPFRLVVECEQCQRVIAGMDDAAVAYFPHLVFENLPYTLKPRADEPKDEKPEKERKHDLWMPLPYRVETLYRIDVPAIFRPVKLPESGEYAWGPVRFVRQCKQMPNGDLELRFVLESSRTRLTPKEIAEVRAGLKDQYKAAAELIQFSTRTNELVALGKFEEALSIARAAVAESPAAVAPLIRLSRLLLAAGLGGPSVIEAQKAVDLKPDSSPAWQALGWSYQHDAFGRRFRGKWQRDKAIAAYRKAVELAPKDTVAQADLAILLEHNALGFRYGRGADFGEAIKEYRAALAASATPLPVLETNLAIALLYAGRTDEAATALKKCPEATQHIVGLVITAINEGAGRAVLEAQTRFPDPNVRVNFLVQAGITLSQLRRYDLASDVFRAGARLNNSAELQGRADLVAQIKKHEEIRLPPTDPRAPAQLLILTSLSGDLKLDELRALFTSREDWRDSDRSIRRLREETDAILSKAVATGMNVDNMLDATLSLANFNHKGDDARGHIVSGQALGDAKMPRIYVTREGESYRILGTSDSAEHVGSLVLDLLDSGDLDSAAWWLDQVVEDLKPAKEEDSLPVARWLWTGRVKRTITAQVIRTTAASLLGRYSASPKAVKVLLEARTKAGTDLERNQIDVALCESYTKSERWADLATVARRLIPSKTFSDDGYKYLWRALSADAKWDALEAAALKRLQAAANDTDAIRAVLTAKAKRRDTAGVKEWAEKLTGREFKLPGDLPFAAWMLMLAGHADAETAELLNADQKPGSTRSQDSLYALAMLHARLRQPDAAISTLRQTVNSTEFEGLDARAWVPYGLICLQYGFPAEAQAAFARARESENTKGMARFAADLAPKSESPAASGSAQ